MKPLLVLLTSFLVALIFTKIISGRLDFSHAARIGMSAMLLFTALGHVLYAEGMSLMVPDFIPFKRAMVYGTGILEVLFAIWILIPKYRVIAAWLLITFLDLLLPANIKAALNHLDYQTGTFDGCGPSYLWFRVPLQLFFILWVYLSAIKT